MGAKEVQELGIAMAALNNVTRDQAGNVLDVFITDVEDQTAFGVNSEGYVRKLLGNAFGETKADAFLERIMIGEDAKGLDALKWMSSREVANIIEDEHPQIIAIVVAFLDSLQAAEVIELLPEELRHDIVMRVARLNDVQQSALAEIEALIASKSERSTRGTTRKVGGDKVAAEIINALKPDRGEALLGQIKEKNEELSTRIEEMMFVFETLLKIDDRGIQALLREIPNDLLVVALKGCDPTVSEKILGNMSKRAATLLREDMEAKGPIRLSDVEVAQKEILDVLRRLVAAGDINLGRGGEQYV
jgi:flagellar motor switch protein FliG